MLLEIRFLISNNCTRWHGILEELSQNRGWKKVAENLRASSFTEGLSVDTTFSQIHLDGEYSNSGFLEKLAKSQK